MYVEGEKAAQGIWLINAKEVYLIIYIILILLPKKHTINSTYCDGVISLVPRWESGQFPIQDKRAGHSK